MIGRRNACPLCWQLTRVPLLQFLPGRTEKGFRCSSCNERIQIARSTQLIGYVGGLLLFGAIGVAGYLLVPSELFSRQGSPWAIVLPLSLIALGTAFPVFAVPFARLTLRLEPWVDETI